MLFVYVSPNTLSSQLAGEAGPSLAVAQSAAWPSSIVVAAASGAEAESAASGLAIATEPTTKLGGELGAVFRKVRYGEPDTKV